MDKCEKCLERFKGNCFKDSEMDNHCYKYGSNSYPYFRKVTYSDKIKKMSETQLAEMLLNTIITAAINPETISIDYFVEMLRKEFDPQP